MTRRDYTLDLPSASKIAGIVMPDGASDGLCWWAAQEAREGRDWRSSRDTAATIGTAAHAAVLREIRGAAADIMDADATISLLTDAELGRARTATEAGIDWWRGMEASGWSLASAEESIESTALGYCGTYDLLLDHPRHGYRIVDLKTANFLTRYGNPKRRIIREKHAIQCALYARLIETRLDASLDGITSGEVVYLPRDTGGAAARWVIEDTPSSPAWTATRRAARQTWALYRYLERLGDVYGPQVRPTKGDDE